MYPNYKLECSDCGNVFYSDDCEMDSDLNCICPKCQSTNVINTLDKEIPVKKGLKKLIENALSKNCLITVRDEEYEILCEKSSDEQEILTEANSVELCKIVIYSSTNLDKPLGEALYIQGLDESEEIADYALSLDEFMEGVHDE